MSADKLAGRGWPRLGNITVAAALLLSTLGSVTSVRAQSSWGIGGSGYWTSAGNWSPLGVPSGVDVTFNSGGTAIIDTDVPTIGTFVGITGGVIQSNGNLTTSTAGLTETRFGQGSTFTYTISGGTLTVTNQIFEVGVNADGNGIFNQSGGTVNSLWTGNSFFLAYAGTSIGTYNMSGGVLNIAGEAILGNALGSEAYFNQSGGSVTITNFPTSTLWLGQNVASSNVYTLSGGTLDTRVLNIGGNGNSPGNFNLNGGTLTTSNLVITLTNEKLNFNGGTLNLKNTSLSGSLGAFVVGNGTSSATLNLQSGGSILSFGGGLTIANNATLKGNGTVTSGAVTINNGGRLAPGSSAGTLTVPSLTLNNTSALDYELGPHNANGSAIVGGDTNDLTVVNGNLTLDGILNVTALDGFGAFGSGLAATNVYRLFNYTGALTDNGLDIGSMPVGTMGFIDTSVSGEVNLFVVPEPSVCGLLALGGIILLWRRRNGPLRGA